LLFCQKSFEIKTIVVVVLYQARNLLNAVSSATLSTLFWWSREVVTCDQQAAGGPCDTLFCGRLVQDRWLVLVRSSFRESDIACRSHI